MVPPAQRIDLDEQVARLVQEKLAELLPLPSTSTRRHEQRQQDSDDKYEWDDLSDQPESSDNNSGTEVFVAPRKRKHKKRVVSFDRDAYTRVCKKALLVKTSKKKSKKTKKHRLSSSDSS